MHINPLYFSFVAFGFAAIQVLVVNLWLLKFEPVEVLALFNYCYLIVIVGSQITTWGVHYSVLHKVSLVKRDAGRYVLSGIVLVLLISVPASLFVFFSFHAYEPKPIEGQLLENTLLISLCLIIVPINKILIAYLNAIKRMYFFSSVYLVRAFLLLVGVLSISIVGLEGSVFRSVVFSELVAMGLLLFAFIVFESSSHKEGTWVVTKKDLKDHFDFGKYSVFGGVALESNVRIDGFYVSIFCSVEQFAKYSFLSLVFEGAQQFHAIIRNFVNTILNDTAEDSKNELKRYMRYSFLYGLFVFSCVLVLFEPIVRLIDIPLLDVYLPALLLSGAILLSSAFLPFDQVSNQYGKPKVFFAMSVSVLIVNVSLNSFLVPYFGLLGASFSTLVAYVVYTFLIFRALKMFSIIN